MIADPAAPAHMSLRRWLCRGPCNADEF